jgi:hypothetical protein
MGRCEGYYRLENRRCDREATQELPACDSERYIVCDYHARNAWSGAVARWHGESGLRSSLPAGLAEAARSHSDAA